MFAKNIIILFENIHNFHFNARFSSKNRINKDNYYLNKKNHLITII